METSTNTKSVTIRLRDGISVFICDDGLVPYVTLLYPDKIEARYNEMGTKPDSLDIITFFPKPVPKP
jgi:hypothetical protein